VVLTAVNVMLILIYKLQ